MTRTRLVTIGETMVLVTPEEPIRLEDAVNFRLEAAGAESNLASHCAQLGVPSAWVSAVGNDPLGHRLLKTISGRGVDTSHVIIDRSSPTGVYFKDPGHGVYYYRAHSAASRLGPEVISSLPLEGIDLLHLTGITPALSQSCFSLVREAINAARLVGVPVSFDINYRPALWPVKTAAPDLEDLAGDADIIFVGLDEARTLWGCRTPEDVRGLFPSQLLVVKNADVGATEFSEADTTFIPAIDVAVVEEVGAGDAFAAGYLSAYLKGAGAADRLTAGHRQAALVLGSTADFVATPKDQGEE